ncbi:MAG: GYF domain-containing protein [Planctomycetaceae bacterium]
MDKWFYKHRSRELGPLSADELRYLASINKIVANTMIRKENSSDWIEFHQSEVIARPISKTTRVTRPALVYAKPLNVDQPQESVLETAATQPNLDHAAPELAIASLTAEERRTRIISVAVVCSLLVMLALLVVLWPHFAGLSGWRSASEEAGNQSVHSGDAGSSGHVKSDSEVSGDNASNDQAVSGAETDVSAAAGDNADQIETPVAPSSATAATTASTEEMAEPEPPDASTSEAATAGSIVEAEPEDRELDAKFAISLPKKKTRTESGAPRRPAKADLQQSDMTARSGEERQQAVADGGGTAESEQAVALALKWLKEQQQADGSWDFRNAGQDAQPGTLDTDLGATAMAMLCFLGAGNTTRTGPEKDVVIKAFDYIKSQKDKSNWGTGLHVRSRTGNAMPDRIDCNGARRSRCPRACHQSRSFHGIRPGSSRRWLALSPSGTWGHVRHRLADPCFAKRKDGGNQG